MPSFEGAPVDCPTRYVVAVVNLLQHDARRRHDFLHLGSPLDSGVWVRVKRLDKDTAASTRQSGNHEGSRIINTQQSSLDTDTSGQQ